MHQFRPHHEDMRADMDLVQQHIVTRSYRPAETYFPEAGGNCAPVGCCCVRSSMCLATDTAETCCSEQNEHRDDHHRACVLPMCPPTEIGAWFHRIIGAWCYRCKFLATRCSHAKFIFRGEKETVPRDHTQLGLAYRLATLLRHCLHNEQDSKLHLFRGCCLLLMSHGCVTVFYFTSSVHLRHVGCMLVIDRL